MTYPEIDLTALMNLMLIIDQAEENPKEYLDPANCPYDDTVRERIAKIVNAGIIYKATVDEKKNPVGRPSKTPALPISEVEKEVDEIRKEIAQLKIDAKGLETQDRIAIIKTRATLVEKIIAMKERITNLKEQRRFITEVMHIMEDVMEQKQREEIIKRLEPFTEE